MSAPGPQPTPADVLNQNRALAAQELSRRPNAMTWQPYREPLRSTLVRTGTINDSDIIGQGTVVLADGSKSKLPIFTIRSLKVGDKIVKNVIAAVLPLGGQLLLGQSFLARFKSWSVDNTKHVLLLNSQ